MLTFSRQLALVLFATAFTFSMVQAQPGGRGGGRGFRGGPGGELQNQETLDELGVTEEQKKKLDEISGAFRPEEIMGDMFQKMREAKNEEERDALRTEIRARFEKAQKESQEKYNTVLSKEQSSRLEQIRLHRAGPRALTNDDAAAELKLSPEQREKINGVMGKMEGEMRSLGFRASPEERAEIVAKWQPQIDAILTKEQRAHWSKKLGPAPKSSGRSGGRAAQNTPPRRPVMITEEAPDGEVAVADFGSNIEVAEKTPVAERKLSFNFRYAPWSDVLKLFAEQADLSLDLNALPPGTFSYYDRGEYTPTEALDVLNGYLLPKGFCLVHRDEFLVCVNIDEEIPPNLIPQVDPDKLDGRGKNELMTVVFPIEGVDVATVAVEVNDIKGPQGKVVGLESINSVLVTDIGSNLRRIRAVLADVTNRTGPDDVSFKPYQIKNIRASEAEATLRSLLGMPAGVTNVSAAVESRSRGERSENRSSDNNNIAITTDARTNKLLISAKVVQHKLIEEALETIDVDGESTVFSSDNEQPFFQVYNVTTSDAREVTKSIDSLMPGIVVNEDGRNGKIHIYGTETQQKQVEALIRQMDGLGTTALQMVVIPLAKMDPVSTGATLRSMFYSDGESAPTIEADVYGRQLMIRGDTAQIAEIRSFLEQMGEDGTGIRKSNSGDRIRTFPLGGRDPEELMPLIQKMWEQTSPSPIRIIRPEDRGPIRGVRSPAGEKKTEATRPETTRPTTAIPTRQQLPEIQATVQKRPSFSSKNVLRTASQTAVINDATAIAQAAPPAAPGNGRVGLAAAAAGDDSEINVTVVGEDLVLVGEPEKLDELEALLESTMQVLPPRNAWTVFTLQSSDATETALMLEQLFPSSSVATAASSSSGLLGSMFDGASSLGDGLMDMTGLDTLGNAQSLTIIPDIRLNALFVTGPSTQVKQVEEMLKVLDANEWPDSYRDKVSRMISIEYATANDVLDIVKETYKAYLEQPNQNRNQGNPLAAIMGGGGRNSRQDQNAPPPAKLALSVDNNTNQLIVWADESLFREIESLVNSIDDAAKSARRTIRVVPLLNTNSSVMQNALGTLMPRVNVSSTGSRRSSTSSTPSATQQPERQQQQGPSPEIRALIEQRMKERAAGGGGGGRPTGGGGGRPGGGRTGGGRPGR